MKLRTTAVLALSGGTILSLTLLLLFNLFYFFDLFGINFFKFKFVYLNVLQILAGLLLAAFFFRFYAFLKSGQEITLQTIRRELSGYAPQAIAGNNQLGNTGNPPYPNTGYVPQTNILSQRGVNMAGSQQSVMPVLLKTIGWLSIGLGLIVGIMAGNAVNDLTAELLGSRYKASFSWSTAFSWWIGSAVSGIVLIAIGMIFERVTATLNHVQRLVHAQDTAQTKQSSSSYSERSTSL
ncbi:hypothetical protein EBB07_03460 [Paenibacillaceae bacterium]|nr:hypothetical protein EBB07_03460 [Paenibacillaceae bacterium]